MNTSHPARRRACRGLTLVELAIVLAIAALLLYGALPSFSALLASARTTAASNTFISGLVLARSEAIKRNARVALCKSADGETCAGTGDWDQGWIVFHDANGDAMRTASETLIWREPAVDSTMKISGNANVSRYISFAPTGGTLLVSGAFQAGTVTVCRRGVAGAKGRQIVLSASGRPRVQAVGVPSC